MDDDADDISPDFLRWEEYAEELENEINAPEDWEIFLWFN